MIFNLYIVKGVKPNKNQLSEIRKLSKEGKIDNITLQEVFKEEDAGAKKEYIKFDKSKFTQFNTIINETNLEQLFIEFLNHLQNGGGDYAVKPK